jgi:hypothetical protein
LADRHAHVAGASQFLHSDTAPFEEIVCNIIGMGKIRAGHVFAMVSRNAAVVGDVGECDVAYRLCGDFTSEV